MGNGRSRKNTYSFESRKRQDLYDFLDMCSATLCNCARCSAELLSIQSRATCLTVGIPAGMDVPEAVAGRINGRPYCRKCIDK